MAHLDYIHGKQGDMTELNEREQQGVYEFVQANEADFKRMDFANSDTADLCEFFSWVYQHMCDVMVPY